MSELLTPLDEQERLFINAQVRTFNLSSADIKTVAAEAGVSERAAQRWFTESGQQRGLIPSAAVGLSPHKMAEARGQQTAVRYAIGRLLTGGFQQDSGFTGTTRQKVESWGGLGDAARAMLDYQEIGEGTKNKFIKVAFSSINITSEGGGIWTTTTTYHSRGELEGSGSLVGTNWEDELDEEDESVIEFEDDDPE